MNRFPDLIRKRAHLSPTKKAVHFEGRDFSFAQFRDRTHGIAKALADLGLEPGDRVAYLGQNSHWLVEMYQAPSIIGAISVPLNYRLSEDEMVGLIDDCTPKILIVDRHFRERAATLMTRCNSLSTLIYADWERALDGLPDGTLHYDQLIEDAGTVADDAFDQIAGDTDDTTILFYTSGTTGAPKGAMLTHANFLINSFGSGPFYGFTPDDIVLLSGPLFHLGTGSRVYTAIGFGLTMVIQSRFEVEATLALIEDQRITATTFVPTMLGMLLDHPEFSRFDISSLRLISYGASPMPLALIERAIEAIPGVSFCQGYGMTETSPVLSVLPPADHVPGNPRIGKLSSTGVLMGYADIRIHDADDNPVPIGTTGEVVVRGPQVMKGYWGRPEETAHAMRGGFFHTGDSGFIDEDGYLTLVGRTKEMIISGGENVYPIETENALSKHPAVAQVAVIGLPHEKWGETVHAVISLHNGQAATAEELIAFSRQKIADFKSPRGITFWEGALPLSTTAKIDKTRIRNKVLEDHGLEGRP